MSKFSEKSAEEAVVIVENFLETHPLRTGLALDPTKLKDELSSLLEQKRREDFDSVFGDFNAASIKRCLDALNELQTNVEQKPVHKNAGIMHKAKR